MYNIHDFTVNENHSGKLVALEKGHDLPFDVKRVYYIWGTNAEVIRGKHAHKKLEQMIICTSGSCDFILDDGKNRETIHLDNPAQGLHIKHNVWREFTNFSKNCVVMVLASEHYDETDYIRNYDDFLNIITTFVEYDKNFLNKSWEWLNNPTIKKLTNTPDFTKEEQQFWFDSLKNKKDYFIQGVKFSQLPVGVWGLKNITQNDAEYFGYIGDTNFWGKGIGQRILKQAINKATELNLQKIYLTVLKDNLRAIKLYEKFNFKEKENKENELVYMELELK